MKKLLSVILGILISSSPAWSKDHHAAEIDKQIWEQVARTVLEGDFDGMAALYHPDSVYVGGTSTRMMSSALAAWKKGLDATKAGQMQASVSFRFSNRIHNETTAFETGIFRYQATQSGKTQIVTVHLEALLVKKDGKWLFLMERQLSDATEEEWDALK